MLPPRASTEMNFLGATVASSPQVISKKTAVEAWQRSREMGGMDVPDDTSGVSFEFFVAVDHAGSWGSTRTDEIVDEPRNPLWSDELTATGVPQSRRLHPAGCPPTRLSKPSQLKPPISQQTGSLTPILPIKINTKLTGSLNPTRPSTVAQVSQQQAPVQGVKPIRRDGRRLTSSQPLVVVLSGKPDERSSAVAAVKDHLQELGIEAMIVPESQSHLRSNGLGLPESRKRPQVFMQRIIVDHQIAQEDAFKAIARLKKQPAVLLLNSCALTPKMSCTDEEWRQVLQLPGKAKITEESLLRRYDLAIHMSADDYLTETGDNCAGYRCCTVGGCCGDKTESEDRKALRVLSAFEGRRLHVVPHCDDFNVTLSTVANIVSDVMDLDATRVSITGDSDDFESSETESWLARDDFLWLGQSIDDDDDAPPERRRAAAVVAAAEALLRDAKIAAEWPEELQRGVPLGRHGLRHPSVEQSCQPKRASCAVSMNTREDAGRTMWCMLCV